MIELPLSVYIPMIFFTMIGVYYTVLNGGWWLLVKLRIGEEDE